MSFSSLANNQAVTFTDMQSSGVPLNSGQSAITSTQCMRKSDLLNMYSVDSSNSYLAGKTSNQIIVKQDVTPLSIYNCPYSTPTYLCALNDGPYNLNGNTYNGVYLNVDVGTTSGNVTVQLSVDQYSSTFVNPYVKVKYGSTITTIYSPTSTTGTISVTYAYTYDSSVGTTISIYLDVQ